MLGAVAFICDDVEFVRRIVYLVGKVWCGRFVKTTTFIEWVDYILSSRDPERKPFILPLWLGRGFMTWWDNFYVKLWIAGISSTQKDRKQNMSNMHFWFNIKLYTVIPWGCPTPSKDAWMSVTTFYYTFLASYWTTSISQLWPWCSQVSMGPMGPLHWSLTSSKFTFLPGHPPFPIGNTSTQMADFPASDVSLPKMVSFLGYCRRSSRWF